MFSSLATAIFGIVGVVAAIFALVASDLDKRQWLKYSIVAILLALSIYAMLASLLGIQPASGDIPAGSVSTPLALSETSVVALRETVVAEIQPTMGALRATNEAMAVAATASGITTTPVSLREISIEAFAGTIYRYTNATTETVVAESLLSLETKGIDDIGYHLSFTIPQTGTVSHGIGFLFSEEQDLSDFDYIELAVKFGSPATDFSFLIRDATSKEQFIRLQGDPPADSGVTVTIVDGYRKIKIPLQYFTGVNMKVLKNVFFVTGTNTIADAGNHSFIVRRIRLGRND